MCNRPSVLVMMATYNGENYVAEQIESILAQDSVNVTLRICDDGSTDGTYTILERYAQAHPNIRVTRNARNTGVGKNFMHMVYEDASQGYEYYAFSDQDDIWLPEKLLHAISALKGMEGPALYYSDVTNFDDMHSWSELSPYRKVLEHPSTLLLRNWAAGCTMVYNHELQGLIRDHRIDSFPRLHDTWVYLVAQACGTVIADLDHSYIRRRISGRNVVGELTDHHRSLPQALRDMGNLFKTPERTPSIVASQLQDEFGNTIEPSLRHAVSVVLAYRISLRSRVDASLHFDAWQPTRRGRLLMRLCFLLGRY